MWCSYIREILGISPASTASLIIAGGGGKHTAEEQQSKEVQRPRTTYVTPASAGPMLASADFHGAKITCVRSKCAGRVGAEGIVVRDTKFTFVIVNSRDEVKIVPKEGAVFRFEVPLVNDGGENGTVSEGKVVEQRGDSIDSEEKCGTDKRLVFELHGEHFKNRAVDRANKKFKMHIPPDL